MLFALILLATILGCFALRTPIHKAPMLFYGLAIAAEVLFLSNYYFHYLPRPMWSALFELMQECTVSLALFVVVMYIGIFSKSSKIGMWLKPIRAELSIIAWILCLGHVCVYGASYLPRIIMGSTFTPNIIASFVDAIALLVLLMVLGVTSFNFVKKHMKTETWKKVQKLAYPFFLLVYAHLLLFLLPAAMRGGEAAMASVAMYSVIFLGYVAGRTYRWAKDRKEAALQADSKANAKTRVAVQGAREDALDLDDPDIALLS